MSRGYSSGCFETRGLTTTPPNTRMERTRGFFVKLRGRATQTQRSVLRESNLW